MDMTYLEIWDEDIGAPNGDDFNHMEAQTTHDDASHFDGISHRHEKLSAD
jgi:hypothetical protein